MNAYYLEITFLINFVLIIMMIIVSQNSLLSKSQKKALVQMYLLLLMVSCFEWFVVFLNGKPRSTMLLHSILKAAEYSIVPYLCIHLLKVIEVKSKSRWLYIVAGANVLLETSSVFTGWTFYIDENNFFQHGKLNWIYTAVCLFCSLYVMIKYFKIGGRVQSSNKKMLIAVTILLLSGVFLKQIDGEVRLELLFIVLVGIFMYIYYIDILQKSDPLTGLLNRGSYISKVSDMSDEAVILYFDIDEFKKINDSYGHIYGDEVLFMVGQTIREVYEKYGLCYRIGGDEFCVILEKHIENIEKLNTEFEQKLDRKRKKEIKLPTVSLGYSTFDPKKDNIDDVIYMADKNMYRTKTKLRKALQETNIRLLATVQAFQIAAEESSTLVFIYELKNQSILVDERTAKAFGVKEKQEGIPYEIAKMGIVSEDTVEEYIKLHEEMLNGASKATGIVKLIQADGTQTTQRLSFRAVYDEEGNPTGTAVGAYAVVQNEDR